MAYRIPPEMPDVYLEGDELRLRQILHNLIQNGLKFTDEGQVVVRVDQQRRTDDRIVLHFAVEDTGIGISEAQEDAIFESFRQIREQPGRTAGADEGGIGLGLAISSRLVELMGGDIWVDSEPGEGSTFHFTAEFGYQPDGGLPDPELRRAVRGLRVMVVDDTAINRRILEEVLAYWDLEPTGVADPQQALRELEQAAVDGEPYELVFLDHVMPGMNGPELAGRMRDDPAIPETPVLLLSSAGERPVDPEDLARFGISSTVPKPVKQRDLWGAVGEVIDGRPRLGEPSEAEELGAELPRDLEVLVAEDSAVNRRLITTQLEEAGHTVTLVEDGREAVEAWEAEDFDVILMDVEMPDMDGLEAASAIRERGADTDEYVPIVALTAHAMKGDKERCLRAGMDEYLSKPTSGQELYRKMGKVITESA